MQLEVIEAIEKRLWRAADTLRANSNYASNEYFLPVMGLVFLRHAYSRYLTERLAVFDLLKKPDLTKADIKRIKGVAVGLLDVLKAEKLRIDQWKDKEATRDAVSQSIFDYLYDENTGLPEAYNENEIKSIAEEVYQHVYRACPELPSPIYGEAG